MVSLMMPLELGVLFERLPLDRLNRKASKGAPLRRRCTGEGTSSFACTVNIGPLSRKTTLRSDPQLHNAVV